MVRALLIVCLLASMSFAEEPKKSGADLLRELEKKNGTDQESLQKKAREARSREAIQALRRRDNAREGSRGQAALKLKQDRYQAYLDDLDAEARYQEKMRPVREAAELQRQQAEYEAYLRSQEPPSVIVVPVTPGPVRNFKSAREAQRAGYYDGYYDSIYWGAYRGW